MGSWIESTSPSSLAMPTRAVVTDLVADQNWWRVSAVNPFW